MKKIVLFFLSFFVISICQTYAESNYQSDYTLIDCLTGSDVSGTPFDSSRPYKTLNEGIEKTVNYINNYVNTGTLNLQSGFTFNIKVNCTLMTQGKINIGINFDGYKYNNFLKIEGIGDNGLSINNIVFDVPHEKGNIIFENAKFLDNSVNGYYFSIDPPERKPYTYASLYVNHGVIIENSYIKLNSKTQIGDSFYRSYYLYGTHYVNYYNSYQYIKNSTIDIDLNSDYNFITPMMIKDSKINFLNNYSTGTYNISFDKHGASLSGFDFDFFSLISNEIDLGGNSFMTENIKDVAFINNKFSNFNEMYLGKNDTNLKYGIFINNLFENKKTINISYNRNIINNVFLGDFVDTYDIKNLRKNYKLDNLGTKGLGWIFQKLHANNLFKINYSSSSLYKEITGIDIPNINNTVYAIFSW